MTNVNGLKTTIKLRYDELDEWITQNPFPDPGEVCVVVIPVGAPSQYDSTIGQYYKDNKLFSYSIGFKVGDGINHFNTLPWIQAAAGDVYSWAKQSEPPNASHLNATYDNQTTTIQAVINSLTNILANLQGEDIAVTYNNQNSDVQTAIASIEESIGDILNSIPAAMRFRGISTTAITDGGVENPTINGIEITSITEGDVVFYGDKEFIWDGSAWEALGDETAGGVSANDLDPIAFNGNVAHLKQTDTILVFNCGNATNELFDD